MSERNTGLGNSRRRSPGEDKGRAESAKSFLALVVCVLGIVFALAAVIVTIVSGLPSGGVASAAAIGIVLGVVGYFLGATRLGIATVVVSIVTLFFGLSVSQGLIPGLEDEDRKLPAQEPGARSPESS